ncbi:MULTISPECIES: hypothetical protein [unclassified Streptomyces]|uniref:hypothetical protein n=1 Tax=Streptomyces sp. NPDC055082 TaxID=3365718 RepID=UPI0037D7D660
MPESTPETNSHGPAPTQMSPELAASLGLTPTPEGTSPTLVPADQAKSEDIGTLSIEYRDGLPVIVVSGGTLIPARLRVVDEGGNAVPAYASEAIAPLVTTRSFEGCYINYPDTDLDDPYGGGSYYRK